MYIDSNMKLIIFTGCTILLLCVTLHAEKEALIFDRADDSLFLFSPNKVTEHEKLGNWVTACPAETTEEDNFIEKYSPLKKNGLFVREIYKEGSKASEVKKNICKKSYEISLAFKMEGLSFHVGYEIYYKLKDEHYFEKHNLAEYKSPEEIIEPMKNRLRKGIYEAKQYFQILPFQMGLGTTNMKLNGEKMGFMWLYLFKVKFDLSKKILEQTWYEIQANNQWEVPEKCEDYSLGSEIYKDISVDELYTTQVEIFEDIELPSDSCESANECLTKWSLVPLDQFRFRLSIPPLCSNITTIPIWNGKVKMLLNKLDKYLYTIFKVLEEPVHITSGIAGYHEFPKKGHSEKSILYLDTKNKKIPVPKRIFKIVEYRLEKCKLLRESLCWYSAIIVINNDPFSDTIDKVCSDDVTIQWGWEQITKDFEGNQFDNIIYVCQNSPSVQKKLSLENTENTAGGLNLSKFKYSKNGGKTILERDLKTSVNKTFKTLSEEGEESVDVDLEKGKIIQRVPTHFPEDAFEMV